MKVSKDFVDQPVDFEDRWHQVRGVWTLNQGAHQFDGHGDKENPEGLLLYEIPLSDGEISAQLYIMDPPEDKQDPCAHIVFHFAGNTDYCVAGIGGWESHYTIGRKTPPGTPGGKPGWERLKGDGTRAEIRRQRWYPITVRFIAGEVTFLYGGMPLFETPVGQPRKKEVFFGVRGFGDCRVRMRIDGVVRKIRSSDVGSRLADADLGFMHLDALRNVAERDLNEVRGFDADDSPKATVILLGSVAEALLLDALWYQETQRPGSTGITNDNLSEWTLNRLIGKANAGGMLDKSTYATSHILREYRNLVHPAKEESMMLAPRPAQAVAAVDFLRALIGDLSTNS